VFKGEAVRGASKDAGGWNCDFDTAEEKPRATCITVRVTSGLCQAVKGVAVQVDRDGGSGSANRGYTDSNGLVAICGLRSGQYAVEARTIRGKLARRRIQFDETNGARMQIGIVYPEESRIFATAFRVETVLKGPALKSVVIESSEASGDCGFGSFAAGTRYEVFAKKTPTGRYNVDLCSGTTALSPATH
jgi:hypothetical protein